MVMLTRRGWGFAGLALLLWIGSRLLGLHDVWKLAILVAAFVVVSALGVVLTALFGRVSTSTTTSQPTPSVGQDILVTTSFRHRLPWRIHLRARWLLGDDTVERVLDVPPGAGESRPVHWVPSSRGQVVTDLSLLTLLGPLGLAQLRLRRKDHAQLLVLPPILTQLPGLTRDDGYRSGATNASGTGVQDNGEPAGALRDYRNGDAMRQVHWKQSARQGQLLVNLPEPEPVRERSLRLETSSDAYPDDASFELAVATAATVGGELLSSTDVLRLSLGGYHTALLHSHTELLRVLACVERDGDPETTDVPGVRWEKRTGEQSDGEAGAVVVTGEVTPELLSVLRGGAAYSSGTLYVYGAARTGELGDGWEIVTLSSDLMPQIAEVDGGIDATVNVTGTQLLLGGLALSGLWAYALLGLTYVLEPGQWFLKAIILAGILTLGGCVLRSLWTTLRSGAAVAAMLAGLALLMWWSHDADRLRGWWQEAGLQFEGIREDILMSSAPMEVGGQMEDIVLLVVLMGTLVSALLLVGLDGFVLAGMVPAGVLLVPAVVLGESVAGITAASVGILIAVLVWVGSQRRTVAGAVAAVTALALTAGMVAWAPTPRDRVWNESITRSPVSTTVPDVTVALGEDLRERSNTVAFSYTGVNGVQMRFPLATLSEFSEGRWFPQEEFNVAGSNLTDARVPDRLEPVETPNADNADSGFAVTITIEGLVSQWLPMPQSPQWVEDTGVGDFERSDWVWIEGSNTARTEERGTRRGDEYRVHALMYVVDQWPRDIFDGLSAEALARYPDSAVAPDAIRPYLELPEDIPTTIAETAEAVTNGAEGRIDTAFALQDYFRSGEFTYDESAPYEPGMDSGSPYAVMEVLLAQKRGYCVHFASTFAVMARSLGLPSRVAVGYASYSRAEGATEVRGGELHAWPEVFVEGVGWLAFEPTPGGPGVAGPEDTDATAAPSPEESTQAAEPTPAGEPTVGDDAPTADGGEAGQPQADLPQDSALARTVPWLLVAVLVAGLGWPGLWRLLRRRRRWNSIRRGERPASEAWSELEDTAVDLGLDVSQLRARTGEAVIELLVESRMLIGEQAITGARTILRAANEEKYAAAVPEETWDIEGNLNLVTANLWARPEGGQRLRARLWPRSVVRWWQRVSRTSSQPLGLFHARRIPRRVRRDGGR